MPAAILPASSCGYRPEVPQANQVVGRHSEGKHPPDTRAAPKACLAAQPDRLQPAEHFLDALAESLADPVASVVRGARVERGELLLRHVRRHVERAETRDEVPVVVVLVRAERDPTAPGNRACAIVQAASHSARPVAWVSRLLTPSPWRFSMSTCPR